MANSVTETLLGAAVLAAAAGFIAYASQTTSFSGGSGYDLRANFISAEGVSIGTDVKMAGVKIGSITRMALNPETYQAELTLTVDNQIRIPDDSDVKISTEGLLGSSFVELTPGGSEFMLQPGEEILMTQSSISFLNLMLRFVTGGNDEQP